MQQLERLAGRGNSLNLTPHHSEEDAEDQRGEVTYPRSHSLPKQAPRRTSPDSCVNGLSSVLSTDP